MSNIIVTRHSGLTEWLRRQGIDGEVISHVINAEQVEGKHVYGALPFHLASLAESVTVVDLPNLPADKRGAELSADEMDAYGATLCTYVVRRLPHGERKGGT